MEIEKFTKQFSFSTFTIKNVLLIGLNNLNNSLKNKERIIIMIILSDKHPNKLGYFTINFRVET